MKFLTLAAAALVTITGVAPAAIAAPAAAQDHVAIRERHVSHTERHYAGRERTRRVCDWKRRNHQRVRVCRTVRWH